MTRLFMPLAATLAFAITGTASAAPLDSETIEPSMAANTPTSTVADRGGGSSNKSSASRSGGQKSGGGSHHAAPSRGNNNSNNNSNARSTPDRSGGSAARPDGNRPGDGASRPDSARPGNSGGSNNSARPDHSRAGHASNSAHQRPNGSPGSKAHAATRHQASTHNSNRAHANNAHRVSTHKRATAHNRASSRVRAVNRYRAWRVGRASHGWRWYHGVFVYPPRSRTTVHVSGGGGSRGGSQASSPDRSLDRTNQVSLGFRTGSYVSGYDNGGTFSDFGLGIQGDWRATEALSLEMAYTYHNDSFDEFSERETALIQPSVELHAFSWSRISPYVSAGVTWAKRSYNDSYFDGVQNRTASVQETASGPHAGLGVELGFGDRAALDLEAQYIGFLNTADDAGAAGGVQGTAGFNVYF